ncbi:MAG: hypothetical protein AAGL24_20085 [Pseudomonadota bacterium]
MVAWKSLVATLVLTLALPGPSFAADSVEAVIETARGECRSLENGVLEVQDGAVTRIDVSGDGEPDAVVDSSKFACSSSASFFCGTGGCAVTIIVDGKTTDFLAKGWKVIDWNDAPVLLLAVHGNACGGTNLRRCVISYVWSEDAFRSAGS